MSVSIKMMKNIFHCGDNDDKSDPTNYKETMSDIDLSTW